MSATNPTHTHTHTHIPLSLIISAQCSSRHCAIDLADTRSGSHSCPCLPDSSRALPGQHCFMKCRVGFKSRAIRLKLKHAKWMLLGSDDFPVAMSLILSVSRTTLHPQPAWNTNGNPYEEGFIIKCLLFIILKFTIETADTFGNH